MVPTIPHLGPYGPHRYEPKLRKVERPQQRGAGARSHAPRVCVRALAPECRTPALGIWGTGVVTAEECGVLAEATQPVADARRAPGFQALVRFICS